MSRRGNTTSSAPGPAWFDVVSVDPAFGVSDLVLERIQAADYAAALATAQARHGPHVLITASMAPRRRRRRPELAKDLGNTTPTRRPR
jgi:hypothetical protein